MNNKQMVIEAINDLPESATIERIQEEVELVAAIRRGKEDIAAGRVHTHEEVREMVAQWSSR